MVKNKMAMHSTVVLSEASVIFIFLYNCKVCFQADSFCRVELPLSPDDEVVIQNARPGKRSTFELDQPTVSSQLKRPTNAAESKSQSYQNYSIKYSTDYILKLNFIYLQSKFSPMDVELSMSADLNRRSGSRKNTVWEMSVQKIFLYGKCLSGNWLIWEMSDM